MHDAVLSSFKMYTLVRHKYHCNIEFIGHNRSKYSFLEFYKNHQIGENGVSIFSQPNEQHVEILNIKT